MTKQADVDREVRKVVEHAVSNGRAAPARWIAHEVAQRHSLPQFPGREWHEYFHYEGLRAAVRRVLREFKPEPDSDPQTTLPGFELVRLAYAVRRDDDIIVVPTDDLEDEEVESKIAELDAMSLGCAAHADELRRYLRERRARRTRERRNK